jgi:predicted phosphoribosyltransferase
MRRSAIFRKVRPKIDLRDKDVIIIDDGVATGATVKAALWSAAHEKPRKITAAFPVGARHSLLMLCEVTDEIVCLKVPPYLGGVGQFYLHFTQVSDEQVLDILALNP